MDIEKLELANKIQSDIKALQEKADMFYIEKHSFLSRIDREEGIKNAKKPGNVFRFLLNRENDKNEVQVNVKPFSGGGYIDVDIDFLRYCAKYWEDKVEQKKKELAEL